MNLPAKICLKARASHPIVLVVTTLLLALAVTARGAQYLSNLGNIYPQGIGDIETLAPGGDTFTAHFSTDAASYQLNSLTIEFLTIKNVSAEIAPWTNGLDIELFELQSGSTNLLGACGNPTVNPTPTQWPQSSGVNAYTTYIDYHPDSPITLQPLAQYALSVHIPENGLGAAGLLFSKSSDFFTAGNWQMESTSATNTHANGEFLKLAIDATVVPEPGTLSVGAVVFLFVAGRRKRATDRSGR